MTDVNEKILIKIRNSVVVLNIGTFIDTLMDENPYYLKRYKNFDFLNLVNQEYLVPSSDTYGFVKWRKIKTIRRTISSNLMKVKTKNGRTLLSQKFLVWNGTSFNSVTNLKIGDNIALTNQLKHEIKNKVNLDKRCGYILGTYLKTKKYNNEYIYLEFQSSVKRNTVVEFLLENGIRFTIDKNNHNNMRIYSKNLLILFQEKNYDIPEFVYTETIDFIHEFLDALFYDKNFYIDDNLYLINGLSFLLSYFGFPSVITENSKNYVIRTQKKFAINQVVLDKIVDIENVKASPSYFYSIETETGFFQLFNGLNVGM